MWARFVCAVLGHSFPPTSTKRDGRYAKCRRCPVKKWE